MEFSCSSSLYSTYYTFSETQNQDTIHLLVSPPLCLPYLRAPKLRSSTTATGHWVVLKLRLAEGTRLKGGNVKTGGTNMGGLELWLQQWTGVRRKRPASESNSARCLPARTTRWRWCCSVTPRRWTSMCCQIGSWNSKQTESLPAGTNCLDFAIFLNHWVFYDKQIKKADVFIGFNNKTSFC